MAAPVRIEAKAWSDLRFATLARLLGLADADHALAKVARLWSWQTEHFTPDRPTYTVDIDTIESVLGPGAGPALVRARLATETPDGYRIHGTEGQIEWCHGLTSKRQRAGLARADAASRDAKGRMIGSEEHTHPAHAGGAGPAPTSRRPAQSSAPDPAPDPSPEDPDLSPARVAAPTPVSPLGPVHDQRPDLEARAAARKLVRATLEAARLRAGAARKVAIKPLLAFDRGLDRDLGERITSAATAAELGTLVDQALHAIAMAELEVTHGGKSFEWFTGSIFSGGNFARLVGMTPEDAKKPPRAKPGEPVRMPARRAEPSPPVVVVSDADRAGAAEELAAARAQLFGGVAR